jgi:hypothetical protein
MEAQVLDLVAQPQRVGQTDGLTGVASLVVGQNPGIGVTRSSAHVLSCTRWAEAQCAVLPLEIRRYQSETARPISSGESS